MTDLLALLLMLAFFSAVFIAIDTVVRRSAEQWFGGPEEYRRLWKGLHDDANEYWSRPKRLR